MAVASRPGMQEAALTPSRTDRSERRRDSRSVPEGDAPAAPVEDLHLFPPEPDVGAPPPRVRAPLRVRRSAHGDRSPRPGGPRRGVARAAEAASPAAGPARPVSARPGLRIAAAGCDLALLGGLDAAVVWLTLRLTGLELDMGSLDILPLPPLVAFLCLLNAGYLVALTAAGGQTIGKMACRLRVADADGGPVSLPRALVRAFWTPVSMTVGLGVVWICLRREGRILHDVLAGTRVLAVPPAAPGPREGGQA